MSMAASRSAVNVAIAIAESAVTGLVADLATLTTLGNVAAKIAKAIVTAKGDLIAATGSGALTRTSR